MCFEIGSTNSAIARDKDTRYCLSEESPNSENCATGYCLNTDDLKC